MRLLLAALVILVTGCASQSSSYTGPVTDATVMDARRRAEVHTALAGEYYARGNHAVALAETRAAIKDDPAYYPAHNMQGLVFMELREDAMARAAFDKALALSPDNPAVLNNFGWFLCLAGETQRGVDMMLRAAGSSLYPTPEKAYLSGGMCLRRAGRNTEAEDLLRRAVLIRPDLIGALYNLALITYERGAMKDAENYLLRYTRVASPNLESLVLGVKIARHNGEKMLEDSFMQQLRRRFPDAPELRQLETNR